MNASEPVIKIGALYALSGAAAAYGRSARDGLHLAVDEINRSGGLLGRPIAIILEDEGSPTQAVERARRLVRQEGVQFLIGIDSSAVAEAIAPLLPQLELILMVTHAATPRITGELFNPYLFRCSIAAHQHARAGALLVSPLPHRRWTTIGPDYAFGYFSWAYFSRYLRELKPDVEIMREVQFHPPGAPDLTPWIRSAMRAGPEAIWVSSWGGDLVNFVHQGQALGLFQRFPVFMELGAALEVLEALGSTMPEGLWVGTRYWFAWADTPVNRHFVDSFYRQYGRYPSYNAQNAYVGMHLLAQAITEADSLDSRRVIQALEGLSRETPMGWVTLRSQDHQGIANAVWGETQADSAFPFRTLEPVWVFDGNEITPRPEIP
ncbi:MAG: ABC transporter substrate-binding protein [Chloroflexi bacterium]|nr:MAG: ABC transporter substrate-binding protein [Chloroflexota bacterium]